VGDGGTGSAPGAIQGASPSSGWPDGSLPDAGVAPGALAPGAQDAGLPGARDAGSGAIAMPLPDASADTGTPRGTPPVSAGGADASACPAAPADAPAPAVQAWTTLNALRVAAGAGCMNLVSALNTSALAHCNYHAANASNAMCIADAHGELMSCSGYTGADAQAREVAAGYPKSLAYSEVATTFGNNPVAAVPSWIDTVWHRIPLLDPWTVDMGYGGAKGCDVIDIGRGMSTAPAGTIVVYPYDGQTNVPPTFSGREGPAPPPPPSGWPSAYPVSIYAQRISVTEHVITKDGDSTPIEHLWLDAKSPEVSAGLKGYFTNTVFLYGAPFELSTKYRVKIVGTHTGGALNVEWTFTTAAKRPFGT
jgi:hypothetical protein